MRDTLLLIALLGGLTWGATYLHRNSALMPSVSAPSATTTAAPSTQGDTHERTNYAQDQRAEGGGTGSASEVDSSEGEVVPDLYSQAGAKPRLVGARSKSARSSVRRQVIRGVPIQEYLDSHKDSLSNTGLAGDDDGGLRVFLQCFEVKSGLEPISDRECDRVFHSPSSPSRMITRGDLSKP